MALFATRKAPAVTLGAQIKSKGSSLRQYEAQQANASDRYIESAQRAKEASLKAAAHALAVEQALSILTEAGVDL